MQRQGRPLGRVGQRRRQLDLDRDRMLRSTAFKWHHLTWEFKRTATNVIFVGFTYDGVTHYVNRSYPARASGVHELNVAFQMDGDSQMHAYSTWLDRVTLTYW